MNAPAAPKDGCPAHHSLWQWVLLAIVLAFLIRIAVLYAQAETVPIGSLPFSQCEIPTDPDAEARPFQPPTPASTLEKQSSQTWVFTQRIAKSSRLAVYAVYSDPKAVTVEIFEVPKDDPDAVRKKAGPESALEIPASTLNQHPAQATASIRINIPGIPETDSRSVILKYDCIGARNAGRSFRTIDAVYDIPDAGFARSDRYIFLPDDKTVPYTLYSSVPEFLDVLQREKIRSGDAVRITYAEPRSSTELPFVVDAKHKYHTENKETTP